ncbi:MAG: urease accessory protein UreE [Microcoleaceae cyanobacterium]
MLVFTQRLALSTPATIDLTLALTADQRIRTRQKLDLPDHQSVHLRLPRGMILNEGDLLQSETQDKIAQITAKPEPVITVTANHPVDLIRAAYHLGNRHVGLEVTESYLRFSPDSVLQSMLIQLGLELKADVAPFNPERGAYGHQNQPPHH